MAGFLLNLKNSRVSKPKAEGKGLFLLKKTPAKPGLARNVLGTQEEDEGPKKTSIDAFDSKEGALSGAEAVSKPKQLVIVPQTLSVGLLKKSKPMNPDSKGITTTDSSDNTKDDLARASLLSGETFDTGNNLTLDLSQNSSSKSAENSEKDYEDVPVEQFGAALLRGMGWDGKMSKDKTTDVSHRQKGMVLGIGSELVGKELEAELMMKRGTKLSVPLIRREKK